MSALPDNVVDGIDNVYSKCEARNHDERMGFMARLGQKTANHPVILRVIEQFLQRSLYERILGLQACHGTRDVAPALDAARSESGLLRARAVPVVALLATVDQIVDLLPSLSQRLRKLLVRKLASSRRRNVFDAIVLELSQREDGHALAEFLPLASPAIIAKLLPQASASLGARQWRSLCRRHPSIAAAGLLEWIKAADHEKIKTVMPLVIQQLARSTLPAEPIFALVRAALQSVPITGINLDKLLRKFPQQVAEILLESDNKDARFCFNSFADRLNPETILELHRKKPLAIVSRFTQKTPLILYNLFADAWRRPQAGAPPAPFMLALPSAQRCAEARLILELQDPMDTHVEAKISMLAFLPWDEAMQHNAAYLSDSDAEVRRAAMCAQIGTARFQRERFGDALALALRGRNERDHIRREIFKSLAQLPRGMWKEEHLPALEELTSQAMEAKDRSEVTLQAAWGIALRLLPVHTRWASAQFANMIPFLKTGYPSPLLGKMDVASCSSGERHRIARELAAAMDPFVKNWKEDGLGNFLLLLVRQPNWDLLLPSFPELLDVLEAILSETTATSEADLVLKILRSHRPEKFNDTIEHLLVTDPSSIGCAAVMDYAYRRRQPLLTPFLALEEEPKGRFNGAADGVPLNLRCDSQAFRLTPKQQDVFAETWVRRIRQNAQKMDQTERRDRSLRQRDVVVRASFDKLPRLCYTNWVGNVCEFLDDENPVAKDSALRMLGRGDPKQGIQELIQAIERGDAPAAIVPLGRKAQHLPKQEALELLRGIPMTKVTVAKEVVRSMAALETEEAYAWLVALAATDPHKDVLVVVLQNLHHYTDKAETWTLLTRLADPATPDPTIARAIASAIPSLRQAPKPSDTAALPALLALLLAHHLPDTRKPVLAYLASASTPPVTDPCTALLSPLKSLTHSPHPTEAKLAAQALFRAHAPRDPELVSSVFAAALSAQDQDWERVGMLCSAYGACVEAGKRATTTSDPGPQYRAASRGVLAALATDPVAVLHWLRLAFLALPPRELLPLIVALPQTTALDPDVLALLGAHVSAGLGAWSDEQVEALERGLGRSAEPAMRALGVAALVAVVKRVGRGSSRGWTESLRARLGAYRADREAVVRRAAVGVWVPKGREGNAWGRGRGQGRSR